MHCMIDLETMGNNNRSPIIAIGAVMFNEEGVSEDTFYIQVSLEDSVRQGMKMDTSTVLWWLKQTEDARSAFKDNESSPSVALALSAFSSWIEHHTFVTDKEDLKVWGNGAAFDNTILTSAYKMCIVPQPWKFWNDRCYRTMKSLFPDVTFTRVGTHHNAVDDARSQALHLIQICKEKGITL